MIVSRIWLARSLIAIASVVIVLLLVSRSGGVQEIRRPVRTTDVPTIESNRPTGDWPGWRGPSSDNVNRSASAPLNWSSSDNIAWQTPIPGRGHSSPCIQNGRIYLSTSDDQKQTISLLCLDQTTGMQVWQTELHRGGFMPIHPKNTQASSSPACDGQHVYLASAINGSIHVSAVDFSGRIVWQHEAGPYQSEWGYGSSVALYRSLVIVCGDQRGNGMNRWLGSSWITAMDGRSGDIVWRVKRVQGDSFGTPIVAHVANRDQLLLAGKETITSYDPGTGNVIWECHCNCKRTAGSVAFDDQHVFASTRQPQTELICVRADGEGDVTQTHVVWRDSKSSSDVPSPCFSEGRLFVVTDDGILTCRNSAEGHLRWKRRLGGTFSASPLVVGQHLYCCNEDGQTFVLAVAGNGEIIAQNSLGEGILASPIISDGKLYIRTLTRLFCISTPTEVLADGRLPEGPPL